MQIAISKNLLHGLERLSKEDRRRTVAMLDKLQDGAASAGIRWHPVMNGFISLSPTMSVRVIAQAVGEKVILHHVDHHDDAYKWAEKHRPMTDASTNTFELLTLPEVMMEAQTETEPSPAFGIAASSGLKRDGIPEYIADSFSMCKDDEDILTCLELMSPEWQEAIWASVSQRAAPTRPTGSSTVKVIREDQPLSEALSYSIASWRTFLHPRQQRAVEDREHRVLCINGGPGTGKSVVCAHRAVLLSKDLADDEVIVVFSYSINLVKDLRGLIADLLPEQARSSRKIWVLPSQNVSDKEEPHIPVLICGTDVVLMAGKRELRVQAIIVDEGQDSPDYFLDFLERAREKTTCTSFTIALDMNQAIFRINHTQALQRLTDGAYSLNLSYCYRMSKPLLDNAFSILTTYAAEYADVIDVRMGLHLPVAVLSGPQVKYIRTESEMDQVERARAAMRDLQSKYSDPNTLVLIHVQYWNPHFAKNGRVDPLAEMLKNDALLGKYYRFAASTKGKEYFGGVLICPNDFMTYDNGVGNIMRLNTLFVSMTRIRDEMTVIYRSNSPTERYLPVMASANSS